MAIGRVPGATGIQPSIVDAKGDLIAATAADSVSRLAAGSNNQVLMADSAQATGLKYANEATATLTTTGDILYASAANTPARLAIGSTDQVLKVSGGIPAWGAAPGGTWTTWTPTATNYTKGNGTETARYLDVNGTIFFFYKFVLGSTSSITGEPSTSLPASVKSGQGDAQIYGIIRDAGTTTFEGSWNIDQPNNRIVWYAANASGTYVSFTNVNTTVPMTWTTNDFIAILGWYEKA